MRVINVITIKDSVVDEITSFGIFEEQLSQDVVKEAEKLFIDRVLEVAYCGSEAEFEIEYGSIETCIEDGYYRSKIGNDSVCLTWSDI